MTAGWLRHGVFYDVPSGQLVQGIPELAFVLCSSCWWFWSVAVWVDFGLILDCFALVPSLAVPGLCGFLPSCLC